MRFQIINTCNRRGMSDLTDMHLLILHISKIVCAALLSVRTCTKLVIVDNGY